MRVLIELFFYYVCMLFIHIRFIYDFLYVPMQATDPAKFLVSKEYRGLLINCYYYFT